MDEHEAEALLREGEAGRREMAARWRRMEARADRQLRAADELARQCTLHDLPLSLQGFVDAYRRTREEA